MIFHNSYKNRRVLVTGHTGFKGSWLAIWLKELGAEVVGYALEPPSEPNNFAASGLEDRITHVHGDVRNLEQLMDAFARYQPEKFSGGWNFGPDNTADLTVSAVVTRFVQAWGAGEWQDLSEPGAVHEAATLRLCCDKAANYLGWRNALAMEQTIEMTAEWYKMFYRGAAQESVYSFCAKQIFEYEKTAREMSLRWTEK